MSKLSISNNANISSTNATLPHTSTRNPFFNFSSANISSSETTRSLFFNSSSANSSSSGTTRSPFSNSSSTEISSPGTTQNPFFNSSSAEISSPGTTQNPFFNSSYANISSSETRLPQNSTQSSFPNYTIINVLVGPSLTTKCANDTQCSKCAFSINIPPATHKYIGAMILVFFVVGQTIHYFYLEEKEGKAIKRALEEDGGLASPQTIDEHHDQEEKDRRERLAYGISTNTYLVAESKTPGGRVTKILEKRKRAIAPPITPAYVAASINGLYESRTKTVQKEEAMICKVQVTVDKWGRGNELISLINDTDVPPSLLTPDEKARYAMELIQQHVEKMTEQKVFIHGLLDERTRILCESDNIEAEVIGEVRLELKLEMTAPVHLLMNVFSAKIDPQMEQQKNAPQTRVSELTSIPTNKETSKPEILQTPASFNKGKSTASNSFEDKVQTASSRPIKKKIPSPDKRERRDSSRRKGTKKTTDLTDLVPLLQQVQNAQANEKIPRERQRTPRESPRPPSPEKHSSGQMPAILRKKKKDASSRQGPQPN